VIRSCLRILIGIAFLIALWSRAPAQDEKPPPKKEDVPKKDEPTKPGDEYRFFFKPPKTTLDFWKAMQFEIDVGRFELAAKHLHALLDKKPADQDLLAIEEKEGLSAFLKLRNIVNDDDPRKWGDDKTIVTQARKDVEELIAQVSSALKRQLSDPERIGKFIRNLSASEEERDYAVKELYRSGSLAVPYLVDAYRTGATPDERAPIIYALARMGKDAVPPMLAALDSDDPQLQVEFIDLLERRGDTSAVPFLWHLAGSPKHPERVRSKAAEALAVLLRTDPTQLPSAKVALTREAERYYRHLVGFTDPGAVTIWRWDGKQVVASWPNVPTVSNSKAEEYYGIRFAQQALDIEPTYQPAQQVLVAIALEKAIERGGYDQPLSKADPAVHDLLATINPALLVAVLERGLADHHLPVILGAVRALGEVFDGRTGTTAVFGEPALVRALNYPNRRVALAAADTLLRLPQVPEKGNGATRSTASVPRARIVEVLRRAVAAEPAGQGAPKIIVGHANADVVQAISKALQEAGFEPVALQSGREVLRRLNAAADVEAVVVDSALPDPGLAQLLGDLRADIHFGLLPVLVLTPPEREVTLRPIADRYRNVHLVPPGFSLDVKNLKEILPALINDAQGPPLSEAELKENAERGLAWLARLARGEVPGYDVSPAADAVIQAVRAGKLSPEALTNGLVVIGRLPGARPQAELANVVLEPNRPMALRVAAAQELVRHLQQHGTALPAGAVEALRALFAAPDTDANLRANVALVMGGMRPDARVTGDRLKDFRPAPPAAAPAPPMPPMPPAPPPPKDN
jgi:CheY-like chemotaxis protein